MTREITNNSKSRLQCVSFILLLLFLDSPYRVELERRGESANIQTRTRPHRHARCCIHDFFLYLSPPPPVHQQVTTTRPSLALLRRVLMLVVVVEGTCPPRAFVQQTHCAHAAWYFAIDRLWRVGTRAPHDVGRTNAQAHLLSVATPFRGYDYAECMSVRFEATFFEWSVLLDTPTMLE